MTESLTIQEAIADSLIALVNVADGIDQPSFAEFLEAEARRLTKRSRALPQLRRLTTGTEAQLQSALHPMRQPASPPAATDVVSMPTA